MPKNCEETETPDALLGDFESAWYFLEAIARHWELNIDLEGEGDRQHIVVWRNIYARRYFVDPVAAYADLCRLHRDGGASQDLKEDTLNTSEEATMDDKLPADLLADSNRCWQFLETLASLWRLEIEDDNERQAILVWRPEFNPCYCHSLQEAYDELHRLHLEDVTISSI